MEQGEAKVIDQRHREKLHGWVAEYCPICRDVQAHALLAGADKFHRHFNLVSCRECGLRSSRSAADYLSLDANAELPIHELIVRTNPLLPLGIWNRAMFDQAASNGQLSAADRASALREPFLTTEYLVVPALIVNARITLSAVVGVVVAGLLSVIIMGFLASVGVGRDMATLVAFGLLAAAVAAVVYYSEIVPKRENRRRAAVMIATSLRPLRPTAEELRETVRILRISGNLPARRTSAEALMTAVQSLADRSWSNVSPSELTEWARALEKEQRGAQDSARDAEQDSASTGE